MVCLTPLQKLIHSEEYRVLLSGLFFFPFPEIQISLREKKINVKIEDNLK